MGQIYMKIHHVFVLHVGDATLETDTDLVRTNLAPSDQYKTMILAGQSPDTIVEITSRAISFWDYQCYQERIYQNIIVQKATDSKSQLESHYHNLVASFKCEIENLKNKLQDKTNDNTNLQKQLNDMNEKYNEKYRQLQRLQSLYDTLKKKTVNIPTLKRLNECHLSTNLRSVDNHHHSPKKSPDITNTTTSNHIKNSTMISTNLCTADDFFGKHEQITTTCSPGKIITNLKSISSKKYDQNINKENIHSNDIYSQAKSWANHKSKPIAHLNSIKSKTGSLLLTSRRQKTPLFDIKNIDNRRFT